MRLVFAYGHAVPGGEVLLADVDAAYVQAKLGGPQLWARTDPSLRPPGLKGYRDPVVPLWGALYGVPRAGYDWDQHAEHILVVVLKWSKIEDGEGTTFRRGRLLLTLYIDDIVIGGEKRAAAKALQELAAHVDLKQTGAGLQRIVGMIFSVHYGPGGRKFVHLSMTSYIDNMVAEFKKLAGIPAGAAFRFECCPAYPTGFTGLRRYEETPGAMTESCRRIIGKALYLGRASRPDALFAICKLAREVSSWSIASDMKLYRLMAYLHNTRDAALQWVYEQEVCLDSLYPYAQADADHADDDVACKSTGLELVWLTAEDEKGKTTMSALTEWQCARQGQQSSSTAESEIVAAHHCITKTLLPMVSVLEQLLQREVDSKLDLDNDAACVAIEKGISPALRYLRKARRISIASTHSLCKSCGILMGRVASAWNHSDLLTKGLKDEEHERHFYGCGLVLTSGRALRQRR